MPRNWCIKEYEVLNCTACHGKMRRVHRTFRERFLYEAVFECQQCHNRKAEPRWYGLYLGETPRCPRCGTHRLTRLATRDKIDHMETGLINFVQRIRGGDLYHCRYCRLQFYDTRRIASERPATPPQMAAAVPTGERDRA